MRISADVAGPPGSVDVPVVVQSVPSPGNSEIPALNVTITSTATTAAVATAIATSSR